MWDNFKKCKQYYINNAMTTLDTAVYGHDDAKNEIKRMIGQWINGKPHGAIIGIEGPPGNGKTTLMKHGLSKCLIDAGGEKRPFAFLPIGGSTNGSTLVGHNFTYVGSAWGKIVEILIDTKCMNPIIFIDEVDKISRTEHGREIIGILTHLTDSTQNDEFEDKYFQGIKLDLSRAMIVFSFNDGSLLDPILRDRMTIIHTNPLNVKEKKAIIQRYILPEIASTVGFNKSDIRIEDRIIEHIIDNYTYEAGVRKLKEKVFEIVREINLRNIYDTDKYTFPLSITMDMVEEMFAKKPKIVEKCIGDRPNIGLVNGLYATTMGKGGLTIIEVFRSQSDKMYDLELTGSQGDVMRESVKCAKTIAWNLIPESVKKTLKQTVKKSGPFGLHIHTPDAATPKDGPSAGGAITLAIVSQLARVPVRHDVAMTGEIDLNGKIHQIGGLLAKLMGAKRAGVTKALVPRENQPDLEAIQRDDTVDFDSFEVVLIDSIQDILHHALVENDLEFVDYTIV